MIESDRLRQAHLGSLHVGLLALPRLEAGVLQSTCIREGHVPRVGLLVHGVQVQGRLQLGLAPGQEHDACTHVCGPSPSCGERFVEAIQRRHGENLRADTAAHGPGEVELGTMDANGGSKFRRVPAGHVCQHWADKLDSCTYLRAEASVVHSKEQATSTGQSALLAASDVGEPMWVSQRAHRAQRRARGA